MFDDCVQSWGEACQQVDTWSPHIWWAMPAVGLLIMFVVKGKL